MEQEEVLKVLEENKGWMVIGEIMVILHENRIPIKKVLGRLFEEGKVVKEEIRKRKGRTNLWKIKDTEDAQNGSKKRTEKQ